jgi:hypothetical protein
MRVFALCATLLLAAVAYAQSPVQVYGPGYGPYVPLLTTPQLSLEKVSPNPVGASNATYGLVAGARNATSEVVNGNTSSSFTEPVWYQGGGAPLVSEPEVSLHARGIHAGHLIQRREPMGERMAGHMGEPRSSERVWTYFPAEEMPSAVEAAASAKSARKATRSITNQDIDAENQKTGTVKYDGKTEKIQ